MAMGIYGPRVPTVAGSALISAFLAFAMICLPAPAAHAQQAAPGAYTDLSRYLVSGNPVGPGPSLATTVPANGGQSSSVIQTGQGNVASATLNGANNLTNQYQAGSNNSSTLSINGAQNAITTSQIGSSNTTSIDVAGNGNSISNLQVGSGLSYELQVVGKSVPVSVQQYGRR
jgi:hypothetical protein